MHRGVTEQNQKNPTREITQKQQEIELWFIYMRHLLPLRNISVQLSRYFPITLCISELQSWNKKSKREIIQKLPETELCFLYMTHFQPVRNISVKLFSIRMMHNQVTERKRKNTKREMIQKWAEKELWFLFMTHLLPLRNISSELFSNRSMHYQVTEWKRKTEKGR